MYPDQALLIPHGGSFRFLYLTQRNGYNLMCQPEFQVIFIVKKIKEQYCNNKLISVYIVKNVKKELFDK